MTIEEQALELYPVDMVSYGSAFHDLSDLDYDMNEEPRKAYIKCYYDQAEHFKAIGDHLRKALAIVENQPKD